MLGTLNWRLVSGTTGARSST